MAAIVHPASDPKSGASSPLPATSPLRPGSDVASSSRAASPSPRSSVSIPPPGMLAEMSSRPPPQVEPIRGPGVLPPHSPRTALPPHAYEGGPMPHAYGHPLPPPPPHFHPVRSPSDPSAYQHHAPHPYSHAYADAPPPPPFHHHAFPPKYLSPHPPNGLPLPPPPGLSMGVHSLPPHHPPHLHPPHHNYPGVSPSMLHEMPGRGGSSGSGAGTGALQATLLAKKSKKPEFLVKLFKMLQCEDPTVICWDSGRIHVHDPKTLGNEVLHKYFRHSKYSSFQRQLNYFGFRKTQGKGKMSACTYTNFDLANSSLKGLLKIKRKTNTSSRHGGGGIEDYLDGEEDEEDGPEDGEGEDGERGRRYGSPHRFGGAGAAGTSASPSHVSVHPGSVPAELLRAQPMPGAGADDRLLFLYQLAAAEGKGGGRKEEEGEDDEEEEEPEVEEEEEEEDEEEEGGGEEDRTSSSAGLESDEDETSHGMRGQQGGQGGRKQLVEEAGADREGGRRLAYMKLEGRGEVVGEKRAREEEEGEARQQVKREVAGETEGEAEEEEEGPARGEGRSGVGLKASDERETLVASSSSSS